MSMILHRQPRHRSTHRPYEVEVCIDSVASAIGAQALGADRVELCSRLDLDGLTPDEDLISATRASIDIDLFVMIRPRGGDFVYTGTEVDEMLSQIDRAIQLGADGIVAGALRSDGGLDLETSRQLMAAAAPMRFTFHRAFDVCREPLKVFAQIDAMGVDRLLTSGQGQQAIDGLEMIETLCGRQSDVQLMAASGVRAEVIPALWQAGVRQYHFTSHRAEKAGQGEHSAHINVFDQAKMQAIMAALDTLSSES